ncbi:DUF4344 domain-containing metallopeptidase [Frigidibacter sp. RF13]|uniref:DUF4344 domain-containing metallopeptidase n=1 Tax=Frigidibacter sp. RF13 TaxID=2997340 RepID=UPI002270E9A9|nr:DUF4344 domain-containing metallopeptidase [Frigidibacter sp. RF13]MCY1127172.1 DUF4344 domain-containing metallopeptidase [Frigidibacter sp. RF13]
MCLRPLAAVAVLLAALFQMSSPARADYENLIGPLGGALGQQLLRDWQAGAEGDWFVLRNTQADNSEQALTVALGPAPENGRLTSVNVSLSSQENTASVGILVRNQPAGSLCLMEVTASASASLFCVVDKQYQEIATVPNAAKLDGSDVIEMVDVPGGARFYLNGQTIGDLKGSAALGSEIGIMAYDRGTFGIADFRVSLLDANGNVVGDATAGGGGGGGGLPPKGGAAGGGAQGGGASGGATAGGGAPTLDSIMGPLAATISNSQKRDGWDLYLKDDWLVMENATVASSENYFAVPAGPVGNDGRSARINVAIAPLDGQRIEDMPYSAVGIIAENRQAKTSCLGEITGAGDALMLCFGADGKANEIGRLKGVAKHDGSDVVELLELPGVAQFLVNGQVVGQVENNSAFGADIGVLAYERGRFYLGGFTITNGLGQSGGAPAQGGGSGSGGGAQGGLTGPLPMFDGDSGRITSTYLGVMTGIFLHEFGHALIGELQIPSTGPEEDAVDIFSALRISSPAALEGPSADATKLNEDMALYAALQWYYSGMVQAQSGGADVPWQDEHTADLKRFRNTFCVMYGGNPDLFAPIAQQVGMDERTLYRCEEEFTKQNRAWRTILAPHTRVSATHPEGLQPADAPGAAITARFEPSRTRVGDMVKAIIGDSGTFQGYVDGLSADFVLPRPIEVIYRDCDELNAWYDPREGTITMCYNLVEYIIVMISDIEMGTVNGAEKASAPAPAGGGNNPFAGGGSGGSGGTNPFGGNGATSGGANPFGGGGGAAPAAPAFDELQDMGVPETRELFLAPYRGATPVSNPFAQVLTTEDLAGMINGGGGMLLIDTNGRGDSLPNAIVVTDAGRDGSLRDNFQKMIDEFLRDQTGGNNQLPVVFFGSGVQDRSAYNAALRAGAIGWNALWYRGGIEAWTANGLPLYPPK